MSCKFNQSSFWFNLILNVFSFLFHTHTHTHSMALILHGEGLCCFKNVRHQHRHNCHSHSPKHDQTYHNNNKMKFEYRPLIEEAAEKRSCANNKHLWSPVLSSKRASTATTMTNDSICTSRSPNHSRSNSLNRSYAFSNGHRIGSDMIRRSSHTISTTSNKIKDVIDLQSNDCLDNEQIDDKMPINCSNDVGIVSTGGCVSNGSAICPIHHYVHRDSSEHTPITSSDSEDLHDHHHHHRPSIVNHLHGNHSHDFSPKNINIQAAVIHVIGDFIQSIGVFISAVIIKYYVSLFIGRKSMAKLCFFHKFYLFNFFF